MSNVSSTRDLIDPTANERRCGETGFLWKVSWSRRKQTPAVVTAPTTSPKIIRPIAAFHAHFFSRASPQATGNRHTAKHAQNQRSARELTNQLRTSEYRTSE